MPDIDRPFTAVKRLTDGSRQITMKRVCENCGRLVGDLNDGELEAAITGRRLLDVADECGCRTRVRVLHFPEPDDSDRYRLWCGCCPIPSEDLDICGLVYINSHTNALPWAAAVRRGFQHAAHHQAADTERFTGS